MITATLLGVFALAPAPDATSLSRTFKKGELLTYEVKSHLQMEERRTGIETFIPEDLDINYNFTIEVMELKTDGIAVVRYRRPTMTIIEGETFDSPPVTKVDKVNLDAMLTVSPVNEVLDIKDQRKRQGKWILATEDSVAQAQNMVGQFIDELYRLAMFTGSLDSSLDVAPRLPLTEVAVGDTWRRTVGYQPQALRGQGKSVVQRLDYTFTYKGPVTVNNKPYRRVEATLKLDTDLATWVKQYFADEDEEVDDRELRRRTGLAKLPVKLNSKIEFDLDPKTGHTMAVRATSQGGFKIFPAGTPNHAALEKNLKGRTTITLKSIGAATPVAPPKPAAAPKKA